MKNGFWLIKTVVSLIILMNLAGCSQSAQQGVVYGTALPSEKPTNTETPVALGTEDDTYAGLRARMVKQTIELRGVEDEDVLRAMSAVPRHRFVPEEWLEDAYADHPLPIGYGQTISQPYIVAWMTELLELELGDCVLEIGTGSGYQAAVLAELGKVDVYSIEIVPELAQRAEETLQECGYEEVQLRQGDGYYGWQEAAPFDAIIVTAAPDHLPQPLISQLKVGGNLVIPIGPPGGYQTLWQFELQPDEKIVATNMGGVAFVPLTGAGITEDEAY